MRTLHAYLTRQVLAAVLLTVAVFTFVMLLGLVLQEAFALLVSGQVSLPVLLWSIALILPWVLAFALPMGMLTATLLIFGRLSADNELTAMRASGISLIALVSPVLLLSAVLSLVSAVVNLHLAPRSRVAYKEMLFSVGSGYSELLLSERTYIKDFPGHILYFGRMDGKQLRDILVYNIDKEGKVESYIRAAEGTVQFDAKARRVDVRLQRVWFVSVYEGERQPVYSDEHDLVENLPKEPIKKTRLSDMTFLQLRAEQRELEERLGAASAPPAGGRGELASHSPTKRALADVTLPVQVQMHRQLSFSFACISFTLVGIPLGIRAHRRETTFGIFVALILVMVYYGFSVLSQSLDTRPEFMPHLLIWIPNFVFFAIGSVMLWRANRGV